MTKKCIFFSDPFIHNEWTQQKAQERIKNQKSDPYSSNVTHILGSSADMKNIIDLTFSIEDDVERTTTTILGREDYLNRNEDKNTVVKE